MIISIIAEFVPAIQAFPSIITAVVVIIVSIGIEERTGVSILKNPTEALNNEGLGRMVGKGLTNFGSRRNLPKRNEEGTKNTRNIQPIQNRLRNPTETKQKPEKDYSKEDFVGSTY